MRMDRTASDNRLPETRPRVESTLMWGFLGLRTFDLAQAGIALASGSLSKSINPNPGCPSCGNPSARFARSIINPYAQAVIVNATPNSIAKR